MTQIPRTINRSALRRPLAPAAPSEVTVAPSPAIPQEPPRAAPRSEGGFAFFLYVLFILSWFLHLTARVPVLGLVRFDLLLVAVTSVFSVIYRLNAQSTLTSRLLMVLVGYVVLTLPLVEWPGSVLGTGFEKLIKAVVFYFFTVSLVTTERRLRITVTAFAAAQAFRFLEPLYLHITDGYWGSSASTADWESFERLSGAPSDIVNPNGLAFVILTALCFMHFVWWQRASSRLAYIALLPAALYALTLTGSRSGMIGLAAIFVAAVVKSRRKLLLVTVVAVAVAAAIPRLGDDLSDRYLSIVSSDTKNAATAEGRIDGIWVTLSVAMRRPLFGHGLGTSAEANANFLGNNQPAHNLVAEVAEELGFCGVLLFAAIVYSIGRDLRHTCAAVKSRAESSEYLLAVADGLQTWLWLNLVFSLASFGLTSYEWYFMAGLAEVLRQLAGVPLEVPASGRPSLQPGRLTARTA